ncbi:hypothetical protein K438DRAFT_1969623 [Mycena galopus ATCC 62051]|nr:hypothetical protein K438DRAFT_1969623 [Mycena galopus ATCC 62051]
MTPIINLHNIVIKSSSNPHNDLPSDMKLFAHFIIDGKILLQTLPVEATAGQNSWKLAVGWKVWPIRGSLLLHSNYLPEPN